MGEIVLEGVRDCRVLLELLAMSLARRWEELLGKSGYTAEDLSN